jgi:hypothetical protein
VGRRYRPSGPTPAVHPSSARVELGPFRGRGPADIYTASVTSYGVGQEMSQPLHEHHQ